MMERGSVPARVSSMVIVVVTDELGCVEVQTTVSLSFGYGYTAWNASPECFPKDDKGDEKNVGEEAFRSPVSPLISKLTDGLADC